MTYEELLISIDLGYENVLPIVGRSCLDSLDNMHWFVVCDDGDCHLFDENGIEDNIKKVINIYENIIPKDIKKIIIPDKVTRISECTFWGCNNLKSIMIPDNVTAIGDAAFYDCCELMSITIPDSITSIGYDAFNFCFNLKSLIFKNKTFNQVEAMNYYPWGIKDKSIIKCNQY